MRRSLRKFSGILTLHVQLKIDNSKCVNYNTSIKRGEYMYREFVFKDEHGNIISPVELFLPGTILTNHYNEKFTCVACDNDIENNSLVIYLNKAESKSKYLSLNKLADLYHEGKIKG